MSVGQALVTARSAPVSERQCDALEAREFLQLYYDEQSSAPGTFAERWEKAQAEILAEGRYQLTDAELTFGARVAWRHSVRCVGR